MRRSGNGSECRLGLTDLLAKPFQRIPRYRLLIKRLLDSTSLEHADFALLKRAEIAIHEFALKISETHKDVNEQQNRVRLLRQLEVAVQGLRPNDLASSPSRALLQCDLVTTTNGPWSRKDRCLFLFNDLVIITNVSKRAAREIRRRSAATTRDGKHLVHFKSSV